MPFTNIVQWWQHCSLQHLRKNQAFAAVPRTPFTNTTFKQHNTVHERWRKMEITLVLIEKKLTELTSYNKDIQTFIFLCNCFTLQNTLIQSLVAISHYFAFISQSVEKLSVPFFLHFNGFLDRKTLKTVKKSRPSLHASVKFRWWKYLQFLIYPESNSNLRCSFRWF